jgi:hypothetical protein
VASFGSSTFSGVYSFGASGLGCFCSSIAATGSGYASSMTLGGVSTYLGGVASFTCSGDASFYSTTANCYSSTTGY